MSQMILTGVAVLLRRIRWWRISQWRAEEEEEMFLSLCCRGIQVDIQRSWVRAGTFSTMRRLCLAWKWYPLMGWFRTFQAVSIFEARLNSVLSLALLISTLTAFRYSRRWNRSSQTSLQTIWLETILSSKCQELENSNWTNNRLDCTNFCILEWSGRRKIRFKPNMKLTPHLIRLMIVEDKWNSHQSKKLKEISRFQRHFHLRKITKKMWLFLFLNIHRISH